MRKLVFAVMACCLAVAATLTVVEGVYSLAQGGTAKASLSHQGLVALGAIEPRKPEARWVYAPYLPDDGEIADLLEPLIQAGVRVGNSRFQELGRASVTTVENGCGALRPNLRKAAFQLRSSAYNPFYPMTVFHDADAPLDPRLTAFFDRYGTPPGSIATNAQGERITLPAVERPRKVLVAGDSVAFGTLVDDRDTIASQLQARDPGRQYVNLGVPGQDAASILCRLEGAMQRYAGQVDELIYVYCQNDFLPDRRYGKPEEVVAWLQAFALREGIAQVTVVFAPYIYTIAPEITRFEGYEGSWIEVPKEDRERLMHAAEAAGFRWIDIGTLAREEQVRQDSQFAMFGLFVDQIHLSRAGTARLVDRLAAR